MSKRVAVLMGGRSAEREVSLVTGAACAEGLRQKGYDVLPDRCRATTSTICCAPSSRVPMRSSMRCTAISARTAAIQGLLDLLGLPYTHSGLLASALAMDKPLAKQVFATVGLRCPEGKVLSVDSLLKSDPFPRPYVVKPADEGSSVGVRIVRDGDNLPPLGSGNWPFGSEVLVERYHPGPRADGRRHGRRGARRSPSSARRSGFYDYEAKYTEGKTEHLIPAPVSAQIAEAAKSMAVAAHGALGCRGVTRCDFRYDDTPARPRRALSAWRSTPSPA